MVRLSCVRLAEASVMSWQLKMVTVWPFILLNLHS